MRFLFYDVETANNSIRCSICSVGWMLLENDSIVQSGYSLINPHCIFSPRNIGIHGITESDVSESPSFSEYWFSTLRDLMASAIVVSHNASFDISATINSLLASDIPNPGLDYIDTLPVFRNLISSKSYKLTTLASSVGYSYAAHNALEDVKALVNVLFYIRDFLHFDDLATLFLRSHVASENTLSNSRSSVILPVSRPVAHKTRCNDNVEIIDQSLSGLRICITGDIPGYERSEVESIIVSHGGRMTTSVSGKTDFLIVGEYTSYGPDYISTKHKNALSVIANGGKLKIIHPDDFFRMIIPEVP